MYWIMIFMEKELLIWLYLPSRYDLVFAASANGSLALRSKILLTPDRTTKYEISENIFCSICSYLIFKCVITFYMCIKCWKCVIL